MPSAESRDLVPEFEGFRLLLRWWWWREMPGMEWFVLVVWDVCVLVWVFVGDMET